MSIYTKYDVEIQLRDKLLGGIPKNPDVMGVWIAKNLADIPEDERAALHERTKEAMGTDSDVEVAETKAWTGFKSNDAGLYVEERQIKACIKECSTVLGEFVKHRGSKNTVQHGLFVKPEQIPLLRDGVAITIPDDFEEGIVHAMTAQGPRTALKRHDYVKRPTITFQIWVVNNKKIPRAMLDRIFELAQENGLGCSRSQGFGKFDVVRFEKVG